jgi:hypothetical protein
MALPQRKKWRRHRARARTGRDAASTAGYRFSLRYFEVHQLAPDWPKFLEDFQRHWPTDAEHTYVDFVRDGQAGKGAARAGNTRWRRMTEQRAGSAKSVFHFDVQGSVAKSTHAGIPWLQYLRRQLGSRLHFWPFDGWSIPSGKSAVVEVYPSLCKHAFPADDRTPDQHDAYAVASWLSEADRSGAVAQGTGFSDRHRDGRAGAGAVGVLQEALVGRVAAVSCAAGHQQREFLVFASPPHEISPRQPQAGMGFQEPQASGHRRFADAVSQSCSLPAKASKSASPHTGTKRHHENHLLRRQPLCSQGPGLCDCPRD